MPEDSPRLLFLGSWREEGVSRALSRLGKGSPWRKSLRFLHGSPRPCLRGKNGLGNEIFSLPLNCRPTSIFISWGMKKEKEMTRKPWIHEILPKCKQTKLKPRHHHFSLPSLSGPSVLPTHSLGRICPPDVLTQSSHQCRSCSERTSSPPPRPRLPGSPPRFSHLEGAGVGWVGNWGGQEGHSRS